MNHLPHPVLLATFLLTLGGNRSGAKLRVDVNLQTGTSAAATSRNLGGFRSYQARHEDSADFTAVRSYEAFGTSVNLITSFPDSAEATTRQMFGRQAE